MDRNLDKKMERTSQSPHNKRRPTTLGQNKPTPTPSRSTMETTPPPQRNERPNHHHTNKKRRNLRNIHTSRKPDKNRTSTTHRKQNLRKSKPFKHRKKGDEKSKTTFSKQRTTHLCKDRQKILPTLTMN